MATQHTPGPWFADKCQVWVRLPGTLVQNPGSYTLSEVYRVTDERCGYRILTPGFGHYDEEQQSADARLISAAPDLLAVCNEILMGPAGHGDGPFDRDTRERLLQAIAKAEGPI